MLKQIHNIDHNINHIGKNELSVLTQSNIYH